MDPPVAHSKAREPDWRTLVDHLPEGVMVLGRDWRIVYLNAEARRLSRIPHGDPPAATLWQLYPELAGTELEQVFCTAMDGGRSGQMEYYHKPFELWVSIQVSPSPDGVVLHYRDITAAKKVDEERDCAIRRLRQVFDASPNSIVCIDRQWNCTYANDVASQLLRGNPVGKNVWKDFPFNRGEPFHSHYWETMVKRTATEFEAYYPEPLNVWFKVYARPFDDGIIIFSSDITARKRSEEVLVSSEARYRALTELNPLAIWMSDASGKITYANQVSQEYTGIPIAPDGSAGEAWLSVFPEGDRQRVYDAWTHSVATGEEYDVQVRMRRASDGELRWWHLRARAIRDDAGQILYWLGIGTDTHDARTYAETLKRQHDETERQRTELETIYETAPIGLALFDPKDFRYLRLNERQAQIAGLPKEAILGRTLTEILPIDGLQEMVDQVAKGIPVRNQVVEGELPTAPGEHRYWTVSYSPVYAPDGSVQAITAASLDITNQKKAEAALIQSEKLAAVGRLASSISHEINNPLEAVTNLLYLIAMTEQLPEELKGYVETAQAEISRVSQIATQTLRFHRQAARATSVTAGELVNAVLYLYQGRLTNSGIVVETRYSTDARILCLENDIRQVLNNLIANAIDAMRKGGRLLVRAHTATDPISGRNGVRITVADTGHGMSPKVRARVFEPFYTTKDLNGTGLGLWISEGIVQRHHGRLAIRSSEDPIHHGTVFSLFLPCDHAKESENLA